MILSASRSERQRHSATRRSEPARKREEQCQQATQKAGWRARWRSSPAAPRASAGRAGCALPPRAHRSWWPISIQIARPTSSPRSMSWGADAIAVTVNTSDQEQNDAMADAAVDAFGRIDACVAAAGISHSGYVSREIDEQAGQDRFGPGRHVLHRQVARVMAAGHRRQSHRRHADQPGSSAQDARQRRRCHRQHLLDRRHQRAQGQPPTTACPRPACGC